LENITFTSTSVANDGTLVEWVWDFGDASPLLTATNGNPVQHIYNAPGTYNAKLTVKTNKGCVSAPSATVSVVVNTKPVADFQLPANVCLPVGQAVFTNQTTISDGTLPAMGYVWNFGDASPTTTTINGTHNYSAVGPFNVQLIATSNNGCKDTAVKAFNNIRPRPTAGFTNNTEVCLSDSLQMSDASNGNGGTITEYHWDFGDGTTSLLQNPKKRWATPGNQTIKHWIVTNQGCTSDTLTKTIYVNRLPSPAFNFSAPQCIDKNITFTDVSVANDGVI
jgi:PKD repeat protein